MDAKGLIKAEAIQIKISVLGGNVVAKGQNRSFFEPVGKELAIRHTVPNHRAESVLPLSDRVALEIGTMSASISEKIREGE